MISQEKFDEIELEHGCGYWNVCCDRACPCAITTEDKGLRQDIWDGFKKEQEELIKEYDNDNLEDFHYEPLVRCKKCGCLEKESDLVNGICDDCYDELIDNLREEEYE